MLQERPRQPMVKIPIENAPVLDFNKDVRTSIFNETCISCRSILVSNAKIVVTACCGDLRVLWPEI